MDEWNQWLVSLPGLFLKVQSQRPLIPRHVHVQVRHLVLTPSLLPKFILLSAYRNLFFPLSLFPKWAKIAEWSLDSSNFSMKHIIWKQTFPAHLITNWIAIAWVRWFAPASWIRACLLHSRASVPKRQWILCHPQFTLLVKQDRFYPTRAKSRAPTTTAARPECWLVISPLWILFMVSQPRKSDPTFWRQLCRNQF